MIESGVYSVSVKSNSSKVIDNISSAVLVSKGQMSKKAFDSDSFLKHSLSFVWPLKAEGDLVQLVSAAAVAEGMQPKITECLRIMTESVEELPFWFKEAANGSYLLIEII